MTISRVSSGSAGTDTVSLGTHAQYDLIVGFAYREGSAAAATVPSGWHPFRTQGGSSNSIIGAFKWAESSSETFGTWTNATEVAYSVYRSDTYVMTFGASSSTNAASTTTWNYPVLPTTQMFSANISWVVGCIGIGDNSGPNNSDTPPSGMTNRTTANNGTSAISLHDTNGAVTGWASTNVTGTNASKYASCVVEVTESTLLIPSGGSAGIKTMRQMSGGMSA